MKLSNLRQISASEQDALVQRGCCAEAWGDIWVSECFEVEQLQSARLKGRVEIGRGARIIESYVANYAIGANSIVDGVTRLECRAESSFGNGTEVATINENGGRTIKIYEGLTSQIAYAWAIYRERGQFIAKMADLVDGYTAAKRSPIATIGENCRLIGAKFIRETAMGDNVVVDGASTVEDATLLEGAYVGVDVKMRHAIAVEGAKIDTGATIERCFIGENVIVANGFTAVDSLMFATSHFENGEAVSIFAGPYSVSHHKSTLLIAGIFSFFNAGSGANQSNHLFKSGPVHQSIHNRGVKFASGAYIMSPAREGAYTMVKGNNSSHHDTEIFPFSYLIGEGRISKLIPAVALVSYGTRRDLEKWPARDKRAIKRDIVSFAQWNPHITAMVLKGLNKLHELAEIEQDTYTYNGVVIPRKHLERGIELYNKGVAAALGAMLDYTPTTEPICSEAMVGEWVDLGGAIMPKQLIDKIIKAIECGEIATLPQITEQLREVAEQEQAGYYIWAKSLLAQLIAREPSQKDIDNCIKSAKESVAYLQAQIESDMERDSSFEMSVGYGHDSSDNETRKADFDAVRNL